MRMDTTDRVKGIVVGNPETLADEKLSEYEVLALELLTRKGGCMLVSGIPDKNERGLFGDSEAGMPVYRKLDKRGLVNLTVEEPEEDGFTFTPSAELTEAGAAALRRHHQSR
jgi:hypothetical protein